MGDIELAHGKSEKTRAILESMNVMQAAKENRHAFDT